MPAQDIFTSHHTIICADSRNLSQLADASVDLVVTSPPYPMITMWDGLFSSFDKAIKDAFDQENAMKAFELCHAQLDKVWKELWRLTKSGSMVCINIGDATRSFSGQFALFPNHSRIINAMQKIGFTVLPSIIWKKSTNSPNKFMGSGMLAAGAYVTLEHEHVLIFRKGDKRLFSQGQESQNRQESSFFWEERNLWFSDIWDLKGQRQKLGQEASRERSAAYALELPWRLIQMYSCFGDTVLDPFSGTGTSSLAACLSARNSIAVEYDKDFIAIINKTIQSALSISHDLCKKRLEDHKNYISNRNQKGHPAKYHNLSHDMPVITRQETKLKLRFIKGIEVKSESKIDVQHAIFEA